jgi:CDP-glucose 4,6-dehydratase
MKEIFFNKKILITGHTGFKGSWLSLWLTYLGAKVVGLSNDIVSNESNFEISKISHIVDDFRFDIRDTNAVSSLVKEIQPDFVFHLAAQSLVRPSYDDPIETITTNAIGTANILNALRILDKKVIIILITSDKVYDNVEWVWGYRETDRLGGKDPYSASKGMAELVIHSYFESFFKKVNSNIKVGITRAGNVIGGGDWAIDRIVPDCIRAFACNKPVNIRNPNATRPWQHVLEPLSGYLALASKLEKDDKYNGEAYNFGPMADQNYSVKKLINEMSKHWCQIKLNDVSNKNDKFHEAGLLKLNCDKALLDLGWYSALKFEQTVKMTVIWYKHYYENKSKDMFQFSIKQIEEYIKIAKAKGITWANYD